MKAGGPSPGAGRPPSAAKAFYKRVKSFFKYRRADQKTRVVEEGTASRGQASEALDSVSGKAPLVTLFTKEGCSTGERASRVQLTESSTTQSSVFQAPAAGSYALAGSAQTHATAVLSSQTLDGGSRQPPARPGHGPVKHLQVADGAISCDFTPRLSPRRSSDASARSTPDDTPGKTDQANSASLGSDASEQDGDSSATKSDEAQQSSGRIALTHDWTVSSLYSIQTAQQDGPVSGQKTALSVLQLSTVLPISMARSSWYLQDFRILSNAETRNKLKVYRAVCVSSGREVDLKTYHKDRMSSAELSTLRQRAFVLSRLSHPSIVKFYGAFEDNHNVYFVLESSQQVDIAATVRLKEAAVINEWLRPLLKAFVYLVSEGICLGLPCLHNLVTTGGSTIKYAEFLSAWDERTQTMYDSDWWSALAPPERCGRLPPGLEPIANREERVLSWAIGTLSVHLLCGGVPSTATPEAFPGDALYDRKVQEEVCSYLSSAVSRDFILSSLDLNPRTRATVTTLDQHPLMSAGGNESPRQSSDELNESSMDSFDVPRGPSIDARVSSRKSLAEGASLGVQEWTTLTGSSARASNSLDQRSKVLQRAMIRTGGVEDAGAASHFSTGEVSTARDDPVMEGASLFMPSRGSSTSRKSLQQEDSQPPTCRQDLRRKLLNDTASNQNKPAVPSSVEKLLQPVVL